MLHTEVHGQIFLALGAAELGGALGAAEVLIDCRKSVEIPPGEHLPAGEGAPRRVRLPFTAETLSEQDLDQFRRECLRAGGGAVAVLSGTGARAAALVVAHAGRRLGWSAEEALARHPGLAGQPALAGFIRAYLARHADRSVRKDLVG